ncbi:ribose-phosphate diphosphokinase [Propionibacteriaceae bacterium Y1700]|uniref:ribose-phosphate diphosphokinase n=1 Tax=Microlunatus sp. Y1700 TaxID=3418487 RepID=UPI003DA76DEC
MTDDITVFTGNAHPEFAQEMCDILGVELSPTKITRFSNDCLQVQLRANCRRKDVYVVQPLVPPVQENLIELLLMLDAARGASANHITAVIPHFSYARSDKKDAPRISIGAKLVADLLATAGATRVITMTLHSEQVHGFFPVPVDHLSAIRELAAHYADKDLTNTVVVSPDFGYAKVASEFARLLQLPVAAGSKRRMGDDTVVIDEIVGDVRGKKVIIIDDEVATAGSMIELMDKLREYEVGAISIATTHGLFTGKAVERLNSQDDVLEIVSTNTVPLTPERTPSKLESRSVAPLFAQAVRRHNAGESISSLFSDDVTYG